MADHQSNLVETLGVVRKRIQQIWSLGDVRRRFLDRQG